MREARARRHALGAAIAVAVMLAACPVSAQGWWPWSNSEPERAPVPDEPIYREPPPPPQGEGPAMQPPAGRAPDAQEPPLQGAPAVNWSTKNPICLQLEQRLVQEGSRSSQTRDRLPAIEAELRQVEHAYEQSESDLERYDCYEYFLFSKTLRRTRRCVDLAQQREQTQRRVSELEAQRQQIASSGGESYRDDIVRELARNNCGANYTQEARRYERGGGDSSSIWQDEGESSFSGRWAPFGGTHSGATYRTVCVRLCDGYYFPVSFSTLPSHFEQDATACQSKCAAPAELYYYQNPGAGMDQSVAFSSQQPYTSLKTAFRYRKELVRGCSCKEAEYVAPDAPAGQEKRAGADATTGWEARSDSDAQGQQQ
jgi:hypothetical protein